MSCMTVTLTNGQKIGKGGVAVRRWIADRWREEGVGSEVGSHCNLTGSSPTQAPAAVLLKEA